MQLPLASSTARYRSLSDLRIPLAQHGSILVAMNHNEMRSVRSAPFIETLFLKGKETDDQ